MSEKNHEFGSLVCIYAQLLPRIREAAKNLGYAVAIHGSMRRDLDLLAVPWVESAGSPLELVEAVRSSVGGYVIGKVEDRGVVSDDPTKQPHGRLSWNICWGGKPFIDLSVVPPKTGLEIGDVIIKKIQNGNVWIERESGEGAEFPESTVSAVLTDFYDKNF